MPKKSKASEATNASADALSGTLEDYFATHRGSGEVSAHLLIGTPNHNAMASEPIDSDVSEVSEATEVAVPSHGGVQEQQNAGQSSDGNGGEDRPVDKSKTDDTSMDGLTLGDYMNVAEDKDDGVSVKKAEKKTAAATTAKAKPKAESGGAVVSGMSLDSYLGVATDGEAESDKYSDDDDHEKAEASLASKKKGKKTLSSSKEAAPSSKKPSKSKSFAPPAPPPSVAPSDDNSTPFQRQQKKKQRVKNKLQQQQQQQGVVMTGSGSTGPVSRSILMAEPLPSPSVHEVTKTSRKKSKAPAHHPQSQSNYHQHQLSPSQSPLPKLAASSLVTHSSGATDHSHSGPSSSITSAISAHHHGSSSSDASSSTDKLPPL